MSTRTFYIVALITLLFSMVMFWFPQIDLMISGWFYQPEHGFLFSHHKHFLNSFRNLMVYFTYGFIGFLTILLLLGLFFKKIHSPFSSKECLFLLICFAVAPTLVVNDVLKNHWGRARPIQVQQFNGAKTFTPAWEMSSQCDHNCSFTSGETANVFCYLALIFVVRRKKLVAGIVLTAGLLMAIARIGQGGHFFSDTVLSGFIDYLLIWLIYQLFEKLDPHYFQIGETHGIS
jgi:lipid A 4'-phosphatase